MKKLLLGSVAIAALAVSPALAADLPARPVYKGAAPVVVAGYDWSGCYIGANVGGVRGRSNINIPLYPANFDLDMSSLVAGGQLGCNVALGSTFILGIEGDADWLQLRGDALTTGAAAERYRVDWNWTASIRGRLGFAAGNALFYVTGGPGWAHLRETNFIPGAVVTTAQSGTHQGWVFGGGIDYGLTQNWVLGVEYLHARYDSKRYTFLGPVDVDLRTDTLRARLSYKFGGWGGPVVARY